VDDFYETMAEILKHNRKCDDCGEKLWICYRDGHVRDKCFVCLEPPLSLDLAGYITRYSIPKEPPPVEFEIKDYATGESAQYLEQHEKAYRLKEENGEG